MKLTFNGTAAAEGFQVFCDVSTVKRRELGEKYRTRSSCLINEEYLIDFPPTLICILYTAV